MYRLLPDNRGCLSDFDESYGKRIADNFLWEAIDTRLKAIECQTAMGDKGGCVADSEANGRVRESLPWLK